MKKIITKCQVEQLYRSKRELSYSIASGATAKERLNICGEIMGIGYICNIKKELNAQATFQNKVCYPLSEVKNLIGVYQFNINEEERKMCQNIVDILAEYIDFQPEDISQLVGLIKNYNDETNLYVKLQKILKQLYLLPLNSKSLKIEFMPIEGGIITIDSLNSKDKYYFLNKLLDRFELS